MRRLFIIRKDLNLSAGKLAAMVAHCAEGYWTNLLKQFASLGCIRDNEFATLPVETDDDPNYWQLYRHPAVAKAAQEAQSAAESAEAAAAETTEAAAEAAAPAAEETK